MSFLDELKDAYKTAHEAQIAIVIDQMIDLCEEKCRNAAMNGNSDAYVLFEGNDNNLEVITRVTRAFTSIGLKVQGRNDEEGDYQMNLSGWAEKSS